MNILGYEVLVKAAPKQPAPATHKESGDVEQGQARAGDQGVMKAYMPEFLYKPPFGYPRSINYPLVRQLTRNPYVFSVVKTVADQVATADWEIAYKEDYEVYVYKPPFPRAPSGKGKPRADGTRASIKGGWAPTYLAAKTQQDRGDFPFELTGDMRIGWLGGPVPSPKEVSTTLVRIVMPEAQALKAEGLAKQKGEFLLLTAEEIDEQTENIRKAYKELVLYKL
jgi:hypothetical protein